MMQVVFNAAGVQIGASVVSSLSADGIGVSLFDR